MPSLVLSIAEEMLNAAIASNGQACSIVLITVAIRPQYGDFNKYLTIIIDAYTRSTSSILLSFLASQAEDFSAPDLKKAYMIVVKSIDLVKSGELRINTLWRNSGLSRKYLPCWSKRKTFIEFVKNVF
jgi:hypothetical protein